MKNVIVTGANGFIGSSLVKRLIAQNINVVAVDVSFSLSNLPTSDKIITIETFITSANELVAKIPIAHYDAFYHFAWAGVNGLVKSDPLVQLKNIEMAIICMAASKMMNCDKFLCAGTIAEQSVKSLSSLQKTSGGMMYGVAKHCTHLMLENYSKIIDQKFVWMQLSNIYGVGNRTGNLVSYTLSELFSGNNPIFGPANQPYDFVYIDDTIEAIYRLGEYETRNIKYYIGSGKPRILKDFLLCIGNELGCPERIGIGKREDDGVKYTFDMFDVSALMSDIGNYISVDFEEGIKNTINWFNKR